MTFDELKIGQTASVTKTFGDADIRTFAELSLDRNPLHLDDEYAATTVFGKRIVYGILVSGLISAVLANDLPGNGTIYLGQTLKFLAPVFIDDTVTASVEIVDLRADKKIVTLDCSVVNQNGVKVISGQAVVKFNV